MPLQFLVGSTGHQENLFYQVRVRPNLWQCTDYSCRATVKTSGCNENDNVVRPAYYRWSQYQLQAFFM